MTSKLRGFCEAFIEAGWLAALILVPLFFNIYSSRVFEPDKISLLRALALLMLGAWIVKQADLYSASATRAESPSLGDRLRSWLRTPLVLPTLILALAYLISTALSVAPRISFWGSYQRSQGTFTMFAYIVIFFLILGHLRRSDQLQRLLYAAILTSVPISLYGIWQRLQQDPLPWGGNVVNRVASNMGNPIFVSAYLIMVFFLTLEQLTETFARMWDVEGGTIWDAVVAGCGLFILIIQVVTGIVLSQSRGPFLGWMAGLYVFTLLGLITLGRWALNHPRFPASLHRAVRWVWLAPIVLAVLLSGFLILFNLPNSPLAGLRQESGLGRMGTILNLESGTNRVRILIWQGVIRLIAPHEPLTYPDGSRDRLNLLRPLIGYGPESMWVAYNPFYPPDLAHYEARNASPDRSHNETFDALVITGVLGFLAYFALFTSIFYYSLRWLGLIRTRADRNRFLALGFVGAVLGVLIPWILDHSLRLAGVGLPFGFIVGIVLYITIAAFRVRQLQPGQDEAPAISPRRELLIIALLSTIVAHFVEIHFGIAIAASRLYFWGLSAVLVLVGTGLLQETPHPAPESAPPPPRSRRRRSRRRSRNAAPQPSPDASSSIWKLALPYILISALVFVTLVYNYITNPVRDTSAWAVFWNSLTTRYLAARGQRVPGLGIIWLVVFTWITGALLAVGQIGRFQRTWTTQKAFQTLGLYTVGTWGVFFVYGLYHASRLRWRTYPGDELFTRVANHFVAYGITVLLVLLALAAALWWQRRSFQAPSRVGLFTPATALVTGVIILILIRNASINPIRADIFYKQGQAYEAEKQWATSIALYQRALALVPKEDYYYLFLGRAQLELARKAKDPARREQLLKEALATLIKARDLNPLNTDHTANLARLYRNWGELVNDPAERERQWKQALTYYETATRLSPNAAHLYNEWGLVHFLLGDLYQKLNRPEEAQQQFDQALARYQQSLALDQRFPQTYLLLGDFYRSRGELAKAARAYEQALALKKKQPRVWDALAYLYAQLGRVEDAITATQQLLRYRPNDAAAHQRLALLYEQAGRLLDALAEAQQARSLAPEAEQPMIDQLIARLESRLKQP